MTPSNPVSEARRKFSIWCESDSLPPYLAAAVEDAGFRRLWLGGPPASLANVEQILSQTSTLQVASGSTASASPHDDLAGAGSDRLADAVVAQGCAAAVAARLGEHLDAGADEVAVQLLEPGPNDDVRPYLIELAAALQRYEAAHWGRYPEYQVRPIGRDRGR
jgi:alkanesulfonate monooxygenase SsuD/methylene tetrahydromethanopterin reductase-like flavin-dependent oxidoreductase (luciferase family)